MSCQQSEQSHWINIYLDFVTNKCIIIFHSLNLQLWFLNKHECYHPWRPSTDSALLNSGQIPQICFSLLVMSVFWLHLDYSPVFQLHGPDFFNHDEKAI